MLYLALCAVGLAIWTIGFALGALYAGGKAEQFRQESEELRESAFRAWQERQGVKR